MNRRQSIATLATFANWPVLANASGIWEMALARAHAMRETAIQNGDQAYGACIADAQGRVIAEAPSRVVTLNDGDAHAERQAIQAAQKILGRDQLFGYVLVGSARACSHCQQAAMRAGIARLVWQGGEADTPLIASAQRNDVQAVIQALGDGAPIDTFDLKRRTALLVAVQNNHEALAQTLVRRGADINAQDDIQDSPFLLAGARGRTGMLKEMLLPPTGSAGRPNYRKLNRYGGTALIPACHYGHVDTVRLLLQQSQIDVDHANRLGWTGLLEAVILGDGGPTYVEIVRLLLAHHANPNKPDSQGQSPLSHARQRGQTAVAALIAQANKPN
jgi:uncharacterized protein